MEYLDIVDEQNNVIGKTTRAEIYEKLLPHRIVHIMIQNRDGKLALQLVAKEKPPYGGHWGTSVGGHVQASESYEDAAIRELKEEFGIEGVPLTKLADVTHITPRGQTKFMRVFTAECEKPLDFDTSETEKIEYFSWDEIGQMRERGDKFAPELLQIIDDHLTKH